MGALVRGLRVGSRESEVRRRGCAIPADVKVALFDLDRTLVRVETASLYVKYQIEIGEARALDLIETFYWVAQYTLGILDASRVAERAFVRLAGTPESELVRKCDDWFVRYVERHVSTTGRATVGRHRDAGDVLAVVTASTVYAATPLARHLDIPHVVASRLELDGGNFTGKPSYPLCYGAGKLSRAETLLAGLGAGLADATFYTDSITDLPLLERVGTPVCVNPDRRLARVAKQRGYRVERWT